METLGEVIKKVRSAAGADWLPAIYRDKIRTQRTRSVSIDIAARENEAIIQYTLLGIELKVGKRRFPCPDLATARYMRVFARFGSTEFAIPYDITRVSTAADELETSWHKHTLMLESFVAGRPPRTIARAKTMLMGSVREEIKEIGSGDAMPAFDRKTRQRS